MDLFSCFRGRSCQWDTCQKNKRCSGLSLDHVLCCASVLVIVDKFECGPSTIDVMQVDDEISFLIASSTIVMQVDDGMSFSQSTL